MAKRLDNEQFFVALAKGKLTPTIVNSANKSPTQWGFCSSKKWSIPSRNGFRVS